MAYDDDDDRGKWGDDESLAALLQQLLGRGDRLTIPQLADLVNKVHAVVRGRGSVDVSVAELSQELRQAGFATVPIGLVEQVVEVAAQIPPDAQAADQISLTQARHILGRIQG
ncbi:hypothetical protein ACN28C_04500 [Plantactinospora sp. WMMC1484]|uniref:hypothetical protein n=1 Tax=Plantactinospora sp. WMMC1484 TaxID=3404122 RepID=UPI003BF49A06